VTQSDSSPHDAAVRRACWPELLFLPDLALALQIDEEEAGRLVVAGECGPYIRVAGRLAVRRESFLAALASQERHVLPPPDSDSADPGGGR